jgi:hypothetical protein
VDNLKFHRYQYAGRKHIQEVQIVVSKVWNRKRLKIASLILPPTLAAVIFVAVWWIVG